jgi:hypothetical protein
MISSADRSDSWAGDIVTRSEIADLMSRYARRTILAQDLGPHVAVSGMPTGQMRDGLQVMFADYIRARLPRRNDLVLGTIPGCAQRTLGSYSPRLLHDVGPPRLAGRHDDE